jgi:arabinan endo-1,5-alpha-L-arabinosidase
MLRRMLVTVVTVALIAVVAVGGARASVATGASSPTTGAAPVAPTLPTTTALLDAQTHRPLSCPDPTVVRAPRPRFDYFLFCTTDTAANAIAIYASRDLVRWSPLGSVFPRGHQPAWAFATGVPHARGHFWAPSINFIDGHWVLYFSAAYNPASHAIPTPGPRAGTMVLGVATSRALGGPWHAQLLHYPGQLNAQNPRGEQEHGGGDIDPAAARDPLTGQQLLTWTEQRDEIWIAGLSANGLAIGPTQQLAFSESEPWECDPANRVCTVEGPQPLFHDGRLFVLYSGASTWDASYAVGAASAAAPFAPFTEDPSPILHSGGGFLGPGGVSDPTIAPDGQTVVLYHALTHVDPTHDSALRLLLLGTLGWSPDGEPTIDDGTP